ncbi:MAG: helicase [Thermoguttaceae bacterium]|nr:helicase [Thermoguttaceae bacterium]
MFNYRDVLDSGGLVARRRPGYERRPAQLAMAAEVDAAIRAKKRLAVEAGTGVGKSFAYLVPAILYAVEQQVREYDPNDYFELPDDESDSSETPDAGEKTPPSTAPERVTETVETAEVDDLSLKNSTRRVVVSTHTISLQEQLFHKDIPFLNAILPFEFTVALAKGRANYVCRRRFDNAMRGAEQGTLFETDRQTEFRRLKEWLERTTDGSKSELDPPVASDVWNEINCEQGNCLGKKCKYRGRCFFARARERLENANIIIVNHALLFSDLALQEGAILPNYDVLIIDEAHTMEEVAADHLGVEMTEYSVEYLLTRLYNNRTNRGLLVDELEKTNGSPLCRPFKEAAERVIDCILRNETFFDSLREWLDERPQSNGRVLEKNIVNNGLGEGLRAVKRAVLVAADLMEDEGRRQEYLSAANRVTSFIAALDDWLEQRGDGCAYWLERYQSRGRPRIALRAAPIDVAPILRENLFNVIPAVITTSATLTTGSVSKRLASNCDEIDVNPIAVESETESEKTRQAFAFFRRRVGLTGAPARALGSPYNYREQATLVLAKGLELTADATEWHDASPEERTTLNERRLWSAISDYVDETDGGAFVLFTNALQMKRATEALETFFADRNYPFYSQSNGMSRQRMVERFKDGTRNVLFGVDSFWQGVDVPGVALRNVIIVKFPFLSPGHPLVEARLQAIEENGGSPFRDYLLPMAILKFKQGFGRLIRTRTDVGQVVLLDERVHTKSYGREFLRALPDCKLRVDVFR